MRYVTIPSPVVVKNPITDEERDKPTTFYEFLTKTLLQEKRFGKGIKELKAGIRIDEAFKDKEPGTVVPVETNDWEMLKDVATAPDAGYQPGAARQLITFIDAVIDAPDKKPDEPKPAEAKAE